MLNLMFTMIVAALSDSRNNATLSHDKQPLWPSGRDCKVTTCPSPSWNALRTVFIIVVATARILCHHCPSKLQAESSSRPAPPTLAAAKGRDRRVCRLPWKHFKTCMPCASAQRGSYNVSEWWKRWKQLCPLYLGTLQSGTSHIEHTHVIFLPYWLCVLSRIWMISSTTPDATVLFWRRQR